MTTILGLQHGLMVDILSVSIICSNGRKTQRTYIEHI